MANHTYSLVASYSVGGQFAQNILHYQFDDAGYADTQSAALALVNAFDTANTTHLRSMLCNSVSVLGYKARALNVAGGFEALKLLAGPPAGTRTGTLAVAAVSPVIILFPNGNAKQRGRVFLPGISDSDLIQGEFQAAFRTAVATHRVMFTQTLSLAGGGTPVASPVVYSRLPLPSTSRVVEYARLSEVAGTIRRRQRPA